MNNSGGDNQPSPPLPAGEYLLQLLRSSPNQPMPHQHHNDPAIASLGPPIHPPLAPHAYIHPRFSPPNPTNPLIPIPDIRNPSEKTDSVSKNHPFSVTGHNYRNNSGLSGIEADYLIGQGFTNCPNSTISGYEMDHRNFPNLVRNETKANYRNSNTPNMSRVGQVREGYNGYRMNNPNLVRIEEGYNRVLNGVEGDYRNSPNLSRFRGGNNRTVNGYQDSLNTNRVLEHGRFEREPRYSNYQGTVALKQEVKQSVKKKSNRNLGQKLDKGKSNSNGSKERSGKQKNERKKDSKIDGWGPGPTLSSDPVVEVEESMLKLKCDMDENRVKERSVGNEGLIEDDSDDGCEEKVGILEEGEGSLVKNGKKKRDKGYRSDTRGQMVLSPGLRRSCRQRECRIDIDTLNAPLLGIYNSLIPLEEEKIKQKQLLTWLENIVIKEWPEARLYVYGSCANSFGVRNSDIDICLALKDEDAKKSKVLLKLADILKAEKLENVQALIHARVPIVKLMDPSTGISCDICINNILAVTNSKLLCDYATIDDRLRQLAFIVKHWAKSRGVNETYHGTLSSYAYVLMCIHFLQQRRPAILPCLQGMDTTYFSVVDNIECAFFDQVEKLSGFGSPNRESIGQLVWGFFHYWAYCHEYARDVISVRVGSMISPVYTYSKRDKDWTRRVGRDRHLICIEDPFETSHDLGRVVDKHSINVLKEEFERAAEILHYDPDPCVTLFEPYAPY